MIKMKIGQLVESYARSFGRIVELMDLGAIAVKFSYLPADKQIVYYSREDAIKNLKFYNDDETAYVEVGPMTYL